MNRRNFCITTALACGAAMAGATPDPKPIAGLLDRPDIPSDEVREITQTMCAEFPGFAERMQQSIAFWAMQKQECDWRGQWRHDGVFLDGLWTGLNFPRAEMVRNIGEWADRTNHWDVAQEIIAWREAVGPFFKEGFNRSMFDRRSGGDRALEWTYGLNWGLSKILEVQPVEVRLAHVKLHAVRMGYQNVADFIDGCVKGKLEADRKYDRMGLTEGCARFEYLAHFGITDAARILARREA